MDLRGTGTGRLNLTDVTLGRQPIFNSALEVVGYELLYRSKNSLNRAAIQDGDQATLQVILNSFLDIGPAELLDNKIGFINLTRNFLVGNYPLPFPPQQTAVEILEDVPVDRRVIEAVFELNQRGYLIALDDVNDLDRVQPLLPLTHIVKIDLRATPIQKLPEIVKRLKPFDVHLLAEKVETHLEYRKCLEMGFDFFQGYFFCKPNTIQRRQMDTTRMVVLQALAYLEDPDIDFAKLDPIISSDVALSYKLLRLVNSGYYSLPNPITSMRQAIAMLGLDQLRGWMTLLMMSQLQNKPHELATEALIRARMADQIARELNVKNTETFFLTGLFSVLDAYTDLPMQDAVKDMPISPRIRTALVNHEGSEGTVLAAIYRFERGDFQPLFNLGLAPAQINQVFTDAVTYSSRLTNQLIKLR